MAQRIEIEGQIARVVEQTTLYETTLEQLMPQLVTRLPTYLPILPDQTKVVAFNPETKRGGLLIEQPPARRNLRIFNDRGATNGPDARRQNENADNIGVFHLQMPWVYFFYGFTVGIDGEAFNEDTILQDFRLDQGFYLWRNEKLTSMDDRLWRGKVPNVDNGSWICWGYTRHDTSSLAERINDMVKNFSSTTFNYHLDAPKPNKYRSYTAWEEDSLKDPLCYLNWDEWTSDQTVVGTVSQFFTRHVDTPLGPVADLSRSTDVIPEPPAQFTVARALDWMNNLPEHRRAQFLHALRRWTDNTPAPENTEDDTDEATSTPELTTTAEPTTTQEDTTDAAPDPNRRRTGTVRRRQPRNTAGVGQ